MNTRNYLISRWLLAAGALVFSLTIVPGAPTGARNLLKNGDFEQPLGPANWTVGYLCGGPDDFEIKGRSRGGSRDIVTGYGGYFRSLSLTTPHAYFTQTVKNLTPGHVYTVSGWMREDYWQNPNKSERDKFLVYIEAIGGKGDATPDGRVSLLAKAKPDEHIDAPYTYPTSTWRQFTVQQTPDASGQIEVRLHYNKVRFWTYDKTWISAASFDNISVTP